LVYIVVSAVIKTAAAAAVADANSSMLRNDDVTDNVTDSDATRQLQSSSKAQLASSASQVISRYVLAKLLGASPAKLTPPAAISGLQFMPTAADISFDALPRLSAAAVSFPTVFRRRAHDNDQVIIVNITNVKFFFLRHKVL